ncbi:short chain enoyl-CoA hydratase /3-hydroxyacyl-CoA dehydrogenase [Arenicella xantha]|uniref:enoyl-CoA hydratase n=2 Tax=Arenicella xantha TaxID=644221 RepID=A0A395JLP8_9GAMM|nr:fatty acid oxidation complex subunit alpha FadJ [Arenicella xantha]RBP50777.1 short chain enoyl-CoA hydratase /3-hydroxyacyl-CoA dehydrogenase [Arenicella xantha]
MSVFNLEKQNDIAIITMNDVTQPQNVLNRAIQTDYEAVFSQLELDTTVQGLIFKSAKPGCFLAGADISMLQGIDSVAQAAESSELLHAMFQRIVDLPFTTVAAIDGVCLGGGLELALAFDYRVASDSKATKIGVPEVQLGILPGGGGTQRLPRLIDLPTALDLLLTGKQLNAKRALNAGLVDSVVPAALLERVAADYVAKRKPRRKQGVINKLMKIGPMRSYVISKARAQALKMTKGHYPAPLKILDVVNRGLGTSLAKGLKIEAQGFAELLMTPVSNQLVNIFFATTELKKDSGVDSAETARDIDHVGVLGAGLMGAGISYVSVAKANHTVRLKDISDDGLAKGISYVGKILDKAVSRRRMKPLDRQATMAKLTGTTDYRGFKNSDVVIEAVFESLELKQKMVADIESLAANKETIFATNTSAIPIDAVAAKAKFPERVVGMHYFSPVEKMPLLEVIKGSKTADWVTATAVELGKQQGKTVIVVNDGPGFYTTRVLVPYNMEAVRLVLEGVSIEEVDAALEDFGMPVGPIKLMDEVGIDVGAHIVTTLNQAFGNRVPLIDGVERVLNDDRQGRKNGRGFYDYSESSKGKRVDETIYQVMQVSNHGRTELSRKDIAERIMLTMLNEAAYCLGEGILRSPRDGDIGAIFGLGFPPFLGGPFRYMDSIGAATIVEKLSALQTEFGKRYTPAPVLLKHAKEGTSFYS